MTASQSVMVVADPGHPRSPCQVSQSTTHKWLLKNKTCSLGKRRLLGWFDGESKSFPFSVEFEGLTPALALGCGCRCESSLPPFLPLTKRAHSCPSCSRCMEPSGAAPNQAGPRMPAPPHLPLKPWSAPQWEGLAQPPSCNLGCRSGVAFHCLVPSAFP